MRCFLIALGFIGEEYRISRKILLSKLEGSSSFRDGAPSKANEEAQAMKKGDWVDTPRFLRVQIEDVLTPEQAREQGYTEPTHYD